MLLLGFYILKIRQNYKQKCFLIYEGTNPFQSLNIKVIYLFICGNRIFEKHCLGKDMIELIKRALVNTIDPTQRIGSLKGLHLQIGVPCFLLISANARKKCNQYRMILKVYQIINLQFQKILEGIKLQTIFLTELRLVYVGIDDQSMHVIQKAAWKFIKIAKFSKNRITWKGVIYLAKCKWTYLNLLQLCKNPIKNKGIEALCKADWPNLRHLYLSACEIDDNSLKVLRKGIMDKLSYINLSGNYFTHNCLKLLATANIKHFFRIDLETDAYAEGLLIVFYAYVYKLPYTNDKYRKIHGSQYGCSYYTKTLQNMLGFLFQ